MGTTTTDIIDAGKKVYGQLHENLSSIKSVLNIIDDGSKVGKKTQQAGMLGYTFAVRVGRNWNFGFRAESGSGVGAGGTPVIKQATVFLKYNYLPVELTGQTIALSAGDARSFIQARALHAKYSVADMSSHLDVLLAAAGPGGRLAVVAASPAPGAGTFYVNKGNGLDALYLMKGMPIDVAPVTGGTLTVTNRTISAIDYVSGLVTHATDTATAAQGVYLAGEAAASGGAFPLTLACLDEIIDDGTISGVTFQGISSSDYPAHKSYVHSTPTDLNVHFLDFLTQITASRGGKPPDFGLLSMAQRTAYVLLGLGNLRFNVDQIATEGQKRALKLGFEMFAYGNTAFTVCENIRPSYLYIGSSDTLLKFEESPLALADDGAGEWTRKIDSSGIADAVDALYRHYLQVGTTHRSAWAKATSLSVPEEWVDKPPVIA